MVSLTELVVGSALLLLGLPVLGEGLRELRTVSHVLRNDPVPVRELPSRSGPIELEGTATPREDGETVAAPFTGTDCLAYRYEAQEYRSSGKNSSWKTLDEGGDAVPFDLADGTGSVRVEPDGADLYLEEDALRVEGGDEPPERIARYIAATDDVDPQNRSLDLVVTELDYGNDQRFVERRLDVGDDVYVYGSVERASVGEWGSDLVDAVVRAGGRGSTFVISDSCERGTALRIGMWGLIWTACGLVLVLPGAWVLLAGSGLGLLS